MLITLRARIEPHQVGTVIVTLQRHHLSGEPITDDAEAVGLPDEALAVVREWLDDFLMAGWRTDG